MDEKKQEEKQKAIKSEERRLNKVFKELEVKRKDTVKSLISSAAFMAASIKELEQIINEKGYTEEYQNGANQKGMKKSSEVEIYNNMIKNYMTCIKQLTDLLPKQAAETAVNDDDFDEFIKDKHK